MAPADRAYNARRLLARLLSLIPRFAGKSLRGRLGYPSRRGALAGEQWSRGAGPADSPGPACAVPRGPDLPLSAQPDDPRDRSEDGPDRDKRQSHPVPRLETRGHAAKWQVFSES